MISIFNVAQYTNSNLIIVLQCLNIIIDCTYFILILDGGPEHFLNQSFEYQRFTPLFCKDIEIEKLGLRYQSRFQRFTPLFCKDIEIEKLGLRYQSRFHFLVSTPL